MCFISKQILALFFKKKQSNQWRPSLKRIMAPVGTHRWMKWSRKPIWMAMDWSTTMSSWGPKRSHEDMPGFLVSFRVGPGWVFRLGQGENSGWARASSKPFVSTGTDYPICDPWDSKIYKLNCHSLMINVGKCSSPVEYVGVGRWHGRPIEQFLILEVESCSSRGMGYRALCSPDICQDDDGQQMRTGGMRRLKRALWQRCRDVIRTRSEVKSHGKWQQTNVDVVVLSCFIYMHRVLMRVEVLTEAHTAI